MKRPRLFILAFAALTLIFASPGSARAGNCSNPTKPEGTQIYSSTYHTMQFCNGTQWVSMWGGAVPIGGGGTCSAPSGLSFTDLTGQSLSTIVASNTPTITFTGCAGTYQVTVTGAATAQISINGGAWTTSGAISSGQTLQVRLTSSSTANTMLTATVTVGSTSTNWNVTTRAGSLNIFVTPNSYIGWQIGSLSNADALCQSSAGAAGYAGTYKAVMSDDTTSAASRLTLSYPIVNAYDGSTVASTNLWLGANLTNVIKTPSGSSGSTFAWTGTKTDGTIVTGNTCSSWTSSGAAAEAGRAGQLSGSWIAYNTAMCTLAYNLICIQQ